MTTHASDAPSADAPVSAGTSVVVDAHYDVRHVSGDAALLGIGEAEPVLPSELRPVVARALASGVPTPPALVDVGAPGEARSVCARVVPLPPAVAGEPLALVLADPAGPAPQAASPRPGDADAERPLPPPLHATNADLLRAYGDLRNLLSATEPATLFLDPALHLLRYTPRAADLLGLGPDDLGMDAAALSRRFGERLADLDVAALAAPVLQSSADPGARAETELAAPGGPAYVARVHPYRTTEDTVEGVVLALVDVTRRRRAEAAAEASERTAAGRLRELEAIYRMAPVGLCVVDAELRFRRINDRMAAINGLPAEAHIGRHVAEILPQLAPRLVPLIERVLATGESVRGLEVSGETAAQPGRTRTWLVSYFPVRNDDGTVHAVNTVSEEITERKAAEDALLAQEETLRLSLEAGSFGVWTADPVAGEMTFDPVARRLLGLPEGESVQDVLERFVDPAQAAAVAAAGRQALAPEPPDTFAVEFELELPGGQRRWLDLRGRCSFRGEGAARQARVLIGVVQDVTERQTTEMALRTLNETLESRVEERTHAFRRTRDLFETLFHASPVPTAIVGVDDGRVVDANAAYCAFFGCDREDVVGVEAGAGGLWPGPAALDAHVPDATHAVASTETTVTLPSGEPRNVYASFSPVDLDGARHVLAAFVDITARRQAEEQVRDLAAALTLAEQRERHRVAQVLHDDLQQLLYGAEVQLRLLDGADAARAAAVQARLEDIIRHAIQVTRTLTVDLSPPVLRGEGLNEAIRWLGYHMEDLHGLRVEVVEDRVVRIAQEEMRVLLFQLVRELLFNVVKHAGVDEARVTLHQDAATATITVEDAGRGFDPTEHADADGFGLFSVRERIRLFGGHLDLTSHPGGGTRAVITVPSATLYE